MSGFVHKYKVGDLVFIGRCADVRIGLVLGLSKTNGLGLNEECYFLLIGEERFYHHESIISLASPSKTRSFAGKDVITGF